MSRRIVALLLVVCLVAAALSGACLAEGELPETTETEGESTTDETVVYLQAITFTLVVFMLYVVFHESLDDPGHGRRF